MSALYGTLASDKGTTTRAGHHHIKACAQSWDGSIIVTLDKDGSFRVSFGEGSTTYGEKVLLQGNLADLRG